MRLTKSEPEAPPARGNPRETHPATATLERFVRGELGRPEARAVVRHLLTRCPRCVGVAGKLWRGGNPARPTSRLAAIPS
jgi:hypothetical protein